MCPCADDSLLLSSQDLKFTFQNLRFKMFSNFLVVKSVDRKFCFKPVIFQKSTRYSVEEHPNRMLKFSVEWPRVLQKSLTQKCIKFKTNVFLGETIFANFRFQINSVATDSNGFVRPHILE